MHRERLIKRLVERKLASRDQAGFGCVPCLTMKVEAVRPPASAAGSKR